MEEAGKSVREMAKVFKNVIEENIHDKLKVDAAIMTWLIRWAAMVISRYRIGVDGKRPMSDAEADDALFLLQSLVKRSSTRNWRRRSTDTSSTRTGRRAFG